LKIYFRTVFSILIFFVFVGTIYDIHNRCFSTKSYKVSDQNIVLKTINGIDSKTTVYQTKGMKTKLILNN
jgi:hypothetical protein